MAYLSETNGVPLYIQLRDLFQQKIASGEWMPYEQIPTEEDLVRKYGVARTTIRRALGEMVQRGLLYRKSGRGTFVREREVQFRLRRSVSFSQDILSKGMRPGARLISVKIEPAVVAIASEMSIAVGTPLVRIVRLRLADDKPVLINDICLLNKDCPDLEKRPELAAPQSSVYTILSRDYGIQIARLKGFIRPVIASKQETKLLEIPLNAPIFRADVVGITTEGRPVIHATDLVRGDWAFDISSD